jgi:hypothetical protein
MAQQQSLLPHTGSPEPNRSKGWSHATEDGPSNALLLLIQTGDLCEVSTFDVPISYKAIYKYFTYSKSQTSEQQ